jgi:hypothetical protein
MERQHQRRGKVGKNQPWQKRDRRTFRIASKDQTTTAAQVTGQQN